MVATPAYHSSIPDVLYNRLGNDSDIQPNLFPKVQALLLLNRIINPCNYYMLAIKQREYYRHYYASS